MEPQDPQMAADAALKRRVVNLVDAVTLVLFFYVAQASFPGLDPVVATPWFSDVSSQGG